MVDLLGDDDLLNLGKRAKSTDPAAVVQEERARKSMPTNNVDLQEFQAKPKESSTCGVCNKNAPKRTCHNCGKRVCNHCSWTMLGLCQVCAREDRVAKFNTQQAPEDNNWLD